LRRNGLQCAGKQTIIALPNPERRIPSSAKIGSAADPDQTDQTVASIR
jgi:hypothetical protein